MGKRPAQAGRLFFVLHGRSCDTDYRLRVRDLPHNCFAFDTCKRRRSSDDANV